MAPHPRHPLPQNSNLVRLPKTHGKHGLTRPRQAHHHPHNRPPPPPLGHGAPNHGPKRAPDQRRKEQQTQRGPPLLPHKHIPHNRGIQHIPRDRQPIQHPGGHKLRHAPARRRQHPGEDKQQVGAVHDGVAPDQLRERRDEQRAGGLAELPDGDEEDAGRLEVAGGGGFGGGRGEVADDGGGDGDDADAGHCAAGVCQSGGVGFGTRAGWKRVGVKKKGG